MRKYVVIDKKLKGIGYVGIHEETTGTHKKRWYIYLFRTQEQFEKAFLMRDMKKVLSRGIFTFPDTPHNGIFAGDIKDNKIN